MKNINNKKRNINWNKYRCCIRHFLVPVDPDNDSIVCLFCLCCRLGLKLNIEEKGEEFIMMMINSKLLISSVVVVVVAKRGREKMRNFEFRGDFQTISPLYCSAPLPQNIVAKQHNQNTRWMNQHHNCSMLLNAHSFEQQQEEQQQIVVNS